MVGIKYYFNQLIDINLLYKNELKQNKLIQDYKRNNNKIDYYDIMGIEHLFRLIYHLPKFMQT